MFSNSANFSIKKDINEDKIQNPKMLWFFMLLYSVCMIYANWFDPRFIQIPIINCVTVAGNLIFPITFLVSNIITEVYGFKHARRAIWCGFLFNIMGVLFGLLVTQFPSPSFSDSSAFDDIVNKSMRIVIASGAAYLASEPINSRIMSRMKIKLPDYLALRFIISTTIAAMFDSVIFITVAFAGIMPFEKMFGIILTMWGIKVFIEVLGTPISVKVTKFLKNYEEMDIYDRNTKYNIFSLDTYYNKNANEFKKDDTIKNTKTYSKYNIIMNAKNFFVRKFIEMVG